MAKGKFQTWNPAMKRWILFENGRIQKTQKEKFSGVPEKGKEPDSVKVKEGNPKNRKPVGHPDNPWFLL